MNQDNFLRELEELLSDLAPEEREEVLRYYRDLFEEAGPEEEQEILRHLGDPMKVAAEIREGLQGDPDAGEFTERGYRDERFDDDYLAPEPYARQAEQSGTENGESSGRRFGAWRQKDFGYGRNAENAGSSGVGERGRNGLLLLVLFLVFGLPLAGTVISAGFSIVGGLFGCVIGILGGLIGLVFGGFVTAAAFLASGVSCVIVGVINLTAPAMGLMVMCLGFLMLAAAMLLLAASRWGLRTAIPGVFHVSIDFARGICGWVVRLFRRLFGKGGAAA